MYLNLVFVFNYWLTFLFKYLYNLNEISIFYVSRATRLIKAWKKRFQNNLKSILRWILFLRYSKRSNFFLHMLILKNIRNVILKYNAFLFSTCFTFWWRQWPSFKNQKFWLVFLPVSFLYLLFSWYLHAPTWLMV